MGDEKERQYSDTIANNVFVRELLKRLERNNLEQNKIQRQLLEAFRDSHDSTQILSMAVRELCATMGSFHVEVMNLRLAIQAHLPNGHPINTENIDGQRK
jgi:hypothetical protein